MGSDFTSESWDRDSLTKNYVSLDCKYPTRCAKSSCAELKLFRHQIFPPDSHYSIFHAWSTYMTSPPFAIYSPKSLKRWILRFQPLPNWVRLSQRVWNHWDCAGCTQWHLQKSVFLQEISLTGRGKDSLTVNLPGYFRHINIITIFYLPT